SGAAVDAALYAVTGQRLATGPDLDQDWLRLKPALPAGTSCIACRGLAQDGCLTDLWVDRVEGPGTRFAIVLRAGRGDARTVVVQCEGVQFQARLAPGEALQQTVPVAAGELLLAPRGGSVSGPAVAPVRPGG